MKVQQCMTTRGSFVHKPMVNFLGGIPEMFSFMQFYQNIDVFRQNDSQGFTTHKMYTNKTQMLEIFFFYFHYLPKLYIGFKVSEILKC